MYHEISSVLCTVGDTSSRKMTELKVRKAIGKVIYKKNILRISV